MLPWTHLLGGRPGAGSLERRKTAHGWGSGKASGSGSLGTGPEAQHSTAVGDGTGIPGRSAGHLSTVMLVKNCPECQGVRAGLASCAHAPRWRRGWLSPQGAARRPLLPQGSGRPASPVLVAGKEDQPATQWSWKPLSWRGGVTVHRPRGRACWCARPPVKAQGCLRSSSPAPAPSHVQGPGSGVASDPGCVLSCPQPFLSF